MRCPNERIEAKPGKFRVPVENPLCGTLPDFSLRTPLTLHQTRTAAKQLEQVAAMHYIVSGT
jgi:hypothetical protein